MSKEFYIYYTYKMALSIMFDIKEKDFKYNEIYFDLNVMGYIQNIVEDLAENNFLNKKVKDNIKNYLQQARDCKDNVRSKRIKIINDTIGYLNSQEKDCSLAFYTYELIRRRNSNRYLFWPTKDIKAQINKIHDSIITDYLIINTHLDNVLDETFKKHFLDKFVQSETYYESLNAILNEMPLIFTIPTFYNRVIDVIEMKNFFDKNNTKISKKIMKRITKFQK